MIQSKFNALHLCEVKFSKNPIGISIIEEVQRKITALNASKSMSIRPILIHVNGVDDAVYGEEFFADIIDFGQFLK
jgi:hypothetical protein